MSDDCAKVEPQGDVCVQILKLTICVEAWENAITRLSSITQPIRKESAKKETGADALSGPLVPLASDLNSMVLKADRLCDRLVEICDEISL